MRRQLPVGGVVLAGCPSEVVPALPTIPVGPVSPVGPCALVGPVPASGPRSSRRVAGFACEGNGSWLTWIRREAEKQQQTAQRRPLPPGRGIGW